MSKVEVSLKGTEVNVEKNGSVAKVKVGNEKLYVDKAKEAGLEKKVLEQVAHFDEAYINAAVDNAVAEAEDVLVKDKDIDEVLVTTPFGLTKSSVATTQVKRAVTSPIPGTDKKVTKSRIKNIVSTTRYNVSKSKIKKLADALSEKVINE